MDRIKAMDSDELKLIIRAVPGKILIDEIGRRYEHQEKMISGARKALRMETSDGITSEGSDEQGAERQIDFGRMGIND